MKHNQCCLLSAKSTTQSNNIFVYAERNIPSANNQHTNDDVRRLWRHSARSPWLPEMGQPHILSTIRPWGLCGRHLRQQPNDTRLWRVALLPLQVSSEFVKFLHINIQSFLFYRYPQKFLNEISMEGNQFWTDIWALIITIFILKIASYYLLRWKVVAVR